MADVAGGTFRPVIIVAVTAVAVDTIHTIISTPYRRTSQQRVSL